jgi:Leucine-rich repeat (LRR) protein
MFTRCDKDTHREDLIYIPDHAFREALIEVGVDSDMDGNISKTEAAGTDKLYVPNRQISDLTGIGYFINLKELGCGENLLTTLDVSKNKLLEILELSRNHITDLDISHNPELIELWCDDNSISQLDMSKQIHLKFLSCNGNQLIELNVVQNEALQYLWIGGNPIISLHLSGLRSLNSLNCSGNLLSTLDLSHNSELTAIYLFSMPDLYEVCVWTEPFPPAGVYVVTDGSPNVYFTTNCK